MRRKLRTKAGQAIYKLRKTIVELVLGHIKEAMGFRQFLLRGREKVQAEWELVCPCHNLLKLFAFHADGKLNTVTRTFEAGETCRGHLPTRVVTVPGRKQARDEKTGPLERFYRDRLRIGTMGASI